MLKLAAKILEYQGAARWQHQLANETGFPQAKVLPVAKNDESPLLKAVIEFGYRCDRSEIAPCVFAARQAHHPWAREFLLDVIGNSPKSTPFDERAQPTKWKDPTGGTWRDARFHAAVGLAELGVEAGVRWLFDRARPNEFGIDESLYHHQHALAKTSKLSENCGLSLRDVLGDPGLDFSTREVNWDDWWEARKQAFSPHSAALRLDR
ncbi:MAG: hypothetical protein KDB14_23530 [Planctomycetales bacterium]|nr:hypothetical protein [Planctomycetales bacterium]